MKKILLLSVSFIFAASVFAQTDMLKPISIGIDVGGEAGLNPYNFGDAPKIYEFNLARAYGKVMLNDRFGLMAGGQMQRMPSELAYSTRYATLFFHGVVDLGEVMNFKRVTKTFGLHAHGGVGAAAMWRPDIHAPNGKLFKNADEIFTWGLGITPYIAIGKRLAINIDYSYTFAHNQGYAYDYSELTNSNGIDASNMTLTVGLSYHFCFCKNDTPYLL